VVIWITGLSGAGKSVIGRRTYELLKARMANVVFVDGDAFRASWGDGIGHTPEDRRVVARRISRFCQFLGDQGIHVVCATISLFHEIQEWNRANIPGYFEVYIQAPLATLIARDPKGVYARARDGRDGHVVGLGIPFEEPLRPDLVLRNGEERQDFTDWALEIARRSGCLRGGGLEEAANDARPPVRPHGGAGRSR
jgi:adenylylsulfate kinase-like enzyme